MFTVRDTMGVPWCILVYSTDFRLPFLLITYPEMASRFLGDWGTWISPWGLLPISRHGLVMWASGVLRTAPKKEPQCFCVLEGTLGKSQAGAAHTLWCLLLCWWVPYSENIQCLRFSIHRAHVYTPSWWFLHSHMSYVMGAVLFPSSRCVF